MIPTMARALLGTTTLAPEGKRILVLLISGLWEMIVPKHPDERATLPPSPILTSMLQMDVPSGMLERGRTFPTWSVALSPQ